MRITFLYTELADYTIACLRALKKVAPGTDILVIHFPTNPEAPFRFEFDGLGEFICVDRFSNYRLLKEKIQAFMPDKIICCGWINKWYVRLCSEFRNKALCVLTSDNHWQNTPKQHLLRIVSGIIFKSVFRKIWVPGAPQKIYAQKLGFNDRNIITGFYCCDLDRYNALYQKFQQQKKQHFPRRFLCVARYIASKNYQILWKAFIRWKEQSGSDWELWCAGTGELFDDRVQHSAIRHLGFVQKNEWEDVIRQTGIFILPSLSEPWAVAVHEFAAAGYPLLLSSRVGAASEFLRPANGWLFHPEKPEQLEACFHAINLLSSEQLNKLADASHQTAQAIAPHNWAASLLQV